jgi:coniferyl-aldehyde dehydrogenase
MDSVVMTQAGTDIAAPARMLAVQRLASRRDGALALPQRLAALKALDAMLRANKDAIAQAISADFGNRAVPETMLGEVVPLLSAIRHTSKHLARWMKPERRQVNLTTRPGSAWVEYHPLGCVGIVSPWNYPLFLTAGPLVDALAAGNRVIIKPSELTPHFSDLFARLIAGAFDPAHVTVVLGGAEIAQAVCALPLDHLLFTGSTQVGRLVMRAAAENLVPVTLELGGKSPVIVCGDYDVAAAAKTIATAKFFNAGQTCIAPDYALVPDEHVDAFAAAMMKAARRMFPAVAGNPDYTSIISGRHHERLHTLLRDAEAGGAKALRLDDAAAERRLGATIMLNPPLDGALMQEEIFGPILPVIGYGALSEAIAFVSDRPRPLALYVFTQDKAALDAVMAGTMSGGVSINTALLHCIQDDLPFGGVGPSGMGAYHGQDGFRRLSHARGVYKAGRFSGFNFLAPPYRRKIRMALKLMLSR